ncbi:aromatic alcohol reductase [Mycobacterium sp. 21AC1]|uniref:aromatic alcohol reductase n=1 Tax=[Mycobacterium] appelbergii TaxID=2939269 RepID=UPI00293951E4|nr:aromatic alcohol reductase [Mycobacterium sp. 21AC1]MDV3126052.1 aromatic alcohol reductase [Mycobacterium sp. 21AC1]
MTTPALPAREGVLVIGSGELGSSVLDALSRHSDRDADLRTVTLMVRRATTDQARRRAEDLAAKGIALIEADIVDATIPELAAIMGRYHTVVSCIGMTAGRGTQLKLAKAAVAGEVPRYFPWQFGMDYDVIGRGSPQDLFDEQLDVRDLLRGQDTTQWVIVSTGLFTSFLFEPSFGVVDLETNTVNALGSWDNEATLTTPEDIGVLTAEIIHARPRIANQVVFVAGDTISYRQLADVVEQVRGKPVTRTEWSLPYLLDELKRHPTDEMKKYHAVFAPAKGVAWPKEESYNALRGIKTTTVADWARDHL